MTQNILQLDVKSLKNISKQNFLKGWKNAMEQLYGADTANYLHNRRTARQQMIKNFKALESPGTQNVDMVCSMSTGQITVPEYIIWLPGCIRYHKFSLEWFFDQCLLKGIYTCTICNTNIISKVKDIKLDILCYTYFDYIAEGKPTLITEHHSSQGVLPENLTDEETLVSINNVDTLVRWTLQKIPAAFSKLMAQSYILEGLYQRATKKKVDVLSSLLESPNEQKTISISMLCQKSYRRVNFPILHKKCNSKNADHGILIFDLYFVLGQLFAVNNPEQSIKCSKCEELFTKDNFEEMCVVDSKLVDCIRKEPKVFNLLYFKLRGSDKTHLPRMQGKYTDEQIQPQNKPKKTEQKDKQMRLSIKNFFNFTPIIYKVYDEAVKKLVGGEPILFELHDKTKLPTRCKKCSKEKKPIDLWQYCLLVACQPGKCPVCSQNFDSLQFIKQIYVDYKMLPFIDQKLNRLILYRSPDNNGFEYNIDIANLKAGQLSNVMRKQKRIIEVYSPEPQKSSNVALMLDPNRQYIPIVQKSCFQQFCSKLDVKEYLQNHVLFVQHGEQPTQKSCNICKTKPKYIFDLLIDGLVHKVLNNKDPIFLYEKGKGYQMRKLLRAFQNIDELMEYIKSRDLMFRQNQRQFSYNICKVVKNSICEEYIKFPVRLKCKCQKSAKTVNIVDLRDLFSENRLMDSCPRCKKQITHPEDLQFLQTLHQAIQNWFKTYPKIKTRYLLAKSGVMIQLQGDYTLVPVPAGETVTTAGNLYESIGKNMFDQNLPYANEYQLFQRMYKNKMEEVKKGQEQHLKINHAPRIKQTAGGIFECRGTIVKRFGDRVR